MLLFFTPILHKLLRLQSRNQTEHSSSTDHRSLSLAFDPSKSPHYKVFCLKRRRSSNSSVSSVSDHYHIEVHSSNEGPWGRLVSVALPPTVIELGNTVFWNGSVHWFGQEEVKILPLPNLDHQEETNLVLEADKVDLEPFPEMIRTEYYTDRRIYAFSVIGIVKEEIDAESYILLHTPNKILMYNSKDKTFKKLYGFEASFDIDAPEYEFYGFRSCFQFTKSLANV